MICRASGANYSNDAVPVSVSNNDQPPTCRDPFRQETILIRGAVGIVDRNGQRVAEHGPLFGK